MKRLEAAAQGDFVVALYNPQSIRRRRLLGAARDILAAARPADTPVVIAKNIGREEEALIVTTLEAFDTEEVDMTTLVLIGSSRTKSIWHGGRLWTYTPRGYSEAKAPAQTAVRQANHERAPR
jgi:cobalt-precorrin 5A hydrolase/precorrin-3B C17-methyltransferase